MTKPPNTKHKPTHNTFQYIFSSSNQIEQVYFIIYFSSFNQIEQVLCHWKHKLEDTNFM
jgi:hypothetical protein